MGGQSDLEGLNLRAANGGWTYHLRVTGGGSTLIRAPEGSGPLETLAPPVVRAEGNTLVIDAAVPPGKWAYWVASSVYSPLTPDGLLRPTTSAGPTHLQAARDDAPVPVDVLRPPGDTSPFTVGTLAAVGQTRDTRLLLLAALGGLGLLLVVVATVQVWRRSA